jgi:hypothetical protein
MRRQAENGGDSAVTTYIRMAGQLGVIVVLFAAVAAFSDRPIYRQTPEGSAVVVLTLVHGADRRAECRRLSPEEIAKLPPNMRKVQDCPRGRRPIHVELELSGRKVFDASLSPTGVAGDGPSRVYQRFVVPAGSYKVVARMRDTPRTDGFDHQRAETVALAAEQMFVVDFRSEGNQFIFR